MRRIMLCHERRITVNKISDISGITQITIGDIVNGATSNAGIATIVKLCDGFDIECPKVFDSAFLKNWSRRSSNVPAGLPAAL